MIRVKFVGGARKSFATESTSIEGAGMSLDGLLSILLQMKPESTPPLDVGNVLVAVNGVDSSALGGMSAILGDGDVVSIIPVIHGGSPWGLRLSVPGTHVHVAEIPGGGQHGAALLEELRAGFPRVRLQAVYSRFVLNRRHLEGIVAISASAEKNRALLSNKFETDLLMRFAISPQIASAIRTAGIRPGRDFLLIAAGSAGALDAFSKKAPRAAGSLFARDNAPFLKRHFGLTKRHLDSVLSDDPLADVLVERAATLFS